VDSLIPILIVAAIAVFVLVIALGKGRLGPNVYQRKANLFSPAETQFLAALDQAISPGQRVFGKVRVMDLVEMKSGLSPKARHAAVNRISQKHVDFLICAGSAQTPVCAIELNDSSHSFTKAQRRDQLLASVCKQVGLPLVVVKAAKSYDPRSVRQQITAATQAEGQGA
jgi:hypothetical protein